MLHPFLAFLFQGDASAPQSPAPAGGPGGAPPQGMFDPLTLVPILLCIVVFWVFMIAPERKQRKKREELLKALKKGDDVVTTSGLYASVIQVQDGVVTLQAADGVRLRYALSSVASVIDPEAPAAKS
jgi:preprotein translocase subunit YajC